VGIMLFNCVFFCEVFCRSLFVCGHFSLGHYIVCPLLIYIFWLHLQYLHVCMIVCLWSFFFRSLHCLSSFDLHLLITPSVPTCMYDCLSIVIFL
jgi:hypothetical protein